MKKVFYTGLVLTMFGLTSCDKKSESDTKFSARLNWRNDFEGQTGPYYSGSQADMPTEISVNAGATVLFWIDVAGDDDDDKPSRLSLRVETDGGVTRSRDINIEDKKEYGNFSFTYPHPAETSFNAYFTLYTEHGDSIVEGPLRVNVSTANATTVQGGGLLTAPNVCGTSIDAGLPYYFIAPYYQVHNTLSLGHAFTCSTDGLSTIEGDRSQFALFGATQLLPGGEVRLVSADTYKEENYLSEYLSKFTAIGFNGVEFELMDFPPITEQPINEADIPLLFEANGMDNYGSLNALTFSSPVKSIAVTNGKWFKFRTVFGKKGVGVVWFVSGKGVSVYTNIQR